MSESEYDEESMSESDEEVEEDLSEIEFNATSWYAQDEDENKDDDNEAIKEKYIIYIFGRKEDGTSITIKVINYRPLFHIRIPDWDKDKCQKAVNHYKSLCPKNNISKIDVIKRHDLHENFCDNKKFNFISFYFNNYRAWNEFAKIFKNRIRVPRIMNTYEIFDTYEKKIDPIITFCHDQDLDTEGWNVIKEGSYKILNNKDVTTDHFIEVSYENVIKYTGELKPLPPLVTTSYDIECVSGDGTFPQADRPEDLIVSICATTNIYGSEKIVRTDVLALNSTKRIKNANMKCFDNQTDLILAWKDTINEIDPDFIIGWNTFGFDNKYVYEKAQQPGVNCAKRFSYISRLRKHKCVFKKENISSAGLGDNEMWLHHIPGREQCDIMKLVMQDFKLSAYSLAKCAEEFMKRKVTIELIGDKYKVFCNIDEVQIGNYIKFEVNQFMIEEKIKILDLHDDRDNPKNNHIIISADIELTPTCKMCLAKDDMGPQELFDSFPKGPEERKRIHEYCVQDCALVNKLAHRLDFVTQRMALASVSSVPFSYIILKGQGIKALSLFAKICKKYKYLIRDMKPSKEMSSTGGKVGYEGATVLDPDVGFYETPLCTLDFNSLYPSVEIAYDMSHETLVTKEEYMNLPNYHYRHLDYNKVINKEVTDEIITTTFATLKTNIDENTATKNQLPGKSGIVGTILNWLLSERKIAKKNMKKFPDKRQIYDGQQKALKVTANSIYGQLGSGVSPVGCIPIAAATTAGGRLLLQVAKDHMEKEFKPLTMKLYKAWKNNRIEEVNAILDRELEDRNNEDFIQRMKATLIELYDKYTIYPKVAYGDTDSNFNNFKITNVETKTMPKDKWCREMNMKLGEIAEKLIKIRLPWPNNMAYEKVIQPIALMAKKNYLGYKYEDDVDEYDFMIMGFKLKRRDGSVVFQKVVGEAISKALNEIDPHGALEFLKKSLQDIIDGKFTIHDFTTSRLLKAKYKGTKITTDDGYDESTPTASIDDINNEIKNITKLDKSIKTGDAKYRERVIEIYNEYDSENYNRGLFRAGSIGEWHWYDVNGAPAHVQLCQRIKERDPGNCPQMNSRIPYVFIVKENSKDMLQGELIEDPDYILKHNLKIDYLFYITNQIQNPATQFFELVTEEIHTIFKNIINQEEKKNTQIFYKKNVEESKKIYTSYGFDFDSDTEDDDAIDKFINKCKNKFEEKKKKRVSKKTNIIKDSSSVTNSIVRKSINFTKF